MKAFPVFALCIAILVPAGPASASTLHYGDFGPDFPSGVAIYGDVRESSGTDPVPPGYYGAPSIGGDELDFDPSGFVAWSAGGNADITDGQLNLNLDVLRSNGTVAGGWTSMLIGEAGDYSLTGSGTAATQLAAGVSVSLDILEVDGTPVTPINAFASNSIQRDLVSDGPVVLAPWSNGLLFEFAPILAANNIDFTFGVTRAELVIDNQLIAMSEPGSLAFIAKKDFSIGLAGERNDTFVPVPPSIWLFGSALLGLIGIARRRSGPPHVRCDAG